MPNLETVLGFVVGFVAVIIIHVGIRAFVAYKVTGKWPHQNQKAKEIFDSLP